MQPKLEHFVKKYASLKKATILLAIPYLLITAPISVPILAFLYIKRKKNSEKILPNTEAKNIQASSKFEAAAAKIPIYVSNVRTQDVLIWCPISASGLTTQLEQLVAILKEMNINFKISYHVLPSLEHPLRDKWIDPIEIKNPKIVFFMERYFPFEVGFANSYQVFYLNIDWFRQDIQSMSMAHADEVIVPTIFKFEEIQKIYGKNRVKYLPWPASCDVIFKSEEIDQKGPIRILYVGNNYDEHSRKNPIAVCDAISKSKNQNFIIDLKFTSAIPKSIKKKLLSNKRVGKVIDYHISRQEMNALYDEADVNLIPNDSEGNGLSIIESYARGVVPAVLAGHPMIEVAHKNAAFHIACEQVGLKEFAPLYKTSVDALTCFFDEVCVKSVREKASNIPKLQEILRQRSFEFRVYIENLMLKTNVIASSQKKLTIQKFRTVDKPIDSENQDILIEVFMTTYRRPDVFEQSLKSLLAAIKASPYKHRLTILSDEADAKTTSIISKYRDLIDMTFILKTKMGLPFTWNMILDLSLNTAARTLQPASYLCYLQDDCRIVDTNNYFATMVNLATKADPSVFGIASGFHTEVHPGFDRTVIDNRTVIVSNSVDGKNLFAPPKTFYTIGKLSWWFPDGKARGNPGPERGSHFDLWQWRESPNSLQKQKRYCFIVPGLCEHIAQTISESTWGNDTTDASVKKRIEQNKIYK